MKVEKYRDLYLGELGNILIQGKGYGFPGHIRQVVVWRESLLITLSQFRDRTSDEELFSNIFAFDLQGNLLWRIEPCPDKMRGYPLHYADLHIRGERLYAREYYDYYYEVDPKTGKVKFVGPEIPEN